MTSSSDDAAALFEESVTWLRDHYGEFEFWVERDVVWTIQTRIRRMINRRRLPYEVFNDYPMIPGTRRSLNTDLIIRSPSGMVLVAAEFKYEPSHSRLEFKALPGKLPVVFWGSEGVAKDITRIAQFVDQGVAESAFSLFVDEGKHFRHLPPHPGSAWYDWPPSNAASHGPAVLRARR